MAVRLKVKIITPKEIAYNGEAVAVTIPAEVGEMQVYPGHIPVLARIVGGVIQIENPGAAPVCFRTEEGFFRVTPDEVHLLMDSVQPVSSGSSA
jgi:F-type H+-transporting ATPase subunit epsilon